MNASRPEELVTAVVADDERLARDELCYLLAQRPGLEVVGQAANGVEALSLVDALQPDVVFLDVQMPGLTGFDVARRLVARPDAPEIVFVTAFDRHAIEAFEVNAVDYLLKPVDAVRLDHALQRTRRRLAADRATPAHAPDQDLGRIVKLVAEQQQRPTRLAVRAGERFHLIDATELIFATVADDVITIVGNSLTGTSNYRTLDELHAQLDPAVYWRVHRSYLVNINKIKEIVPWFSRNYILKMADAKATEIPVSRAQTKRLRDYLGL
ncbi:MAG: LytTR family DNA-binding domain-containing protein [Vicinamibacterales bacterium]